MVVTALEARVDDVNLQFVQQTLINEELKQNGRFGQPTAASSSSSSAGQSADSVLVGAAGAHRVTKCFKCGQPEHIRRYCPTWKKKAAEHRAKTAGECLLSDNDTFDHDETKHQDNCCRN